MLLAGLVTSKVLSPQYLDLGAATAAAVSFAAGRQLPCGACSPPTGFVTYYIYPLHYAELLAARADGHRALRPPATFSS